VGALESAHEKSLRERVRDVEIFSLGAINAPREGEASETLSLSARLRERTRRPTATRRARTARGAGTRASRPCVARATLEGELGSSRKGAFSFGFPRASDHAQHVQCRQTGCLTDCPHEPAPRE
jgi:hypothetical protein